MTNCDYEDCDQEGPVTVRDGTHRCAYHAVVTLLVDMKVDEARRAIDEGNLHIYKEPETHVYIKVCLKCFKEKFFGYRGEPDTNWLAPAANLRSECCLCGASGYDSRILELKLSP